METLSGLHFIFRLFISQQWLRLQKHLLLV